MEDRRTFLKTLAALTGTAAATPAGAWQATSPQKPGTAPGISGPNPAVLKKSTLISMLPKQRSYEERFAIGRDAGFEAIEIGTITSPDQAQEIKAASDKTGLKIHSVMNSDHWRLPLSSADPDVVARSVKGMETSLENAKLWGADAVLLVPAVVDAQTSYRDAWTRSQQVIRERLLPKARDLKVIIAVEEVWNKFLLSPLEFARYVDEFESPWVRAYFDVGNIVFYGYPQDLILTLGSRIVKVHI
jgi:hexulose-6-phosphate isomerase